MTELFILGIIGFVISVATFASVVAIALSIQSSSECEDLQDEDF